MFFCNGECSDTCMIDSKRNRITRKLVGVMQKHRLLEQALPSLFPFSLPLPFLRLPRRLKSDRLHISICTLTSRWRGDKITRKFSWNWICRRIPVEVENIVEGFVIVDSSFGASSPCKLAEEIFVCLQG